MYVITKIVEYYDETNVNCFKLTNSLEGIEEEIKQDISSLNGLLDYAKYLRFDEEKGEYRSSDDCGVLIRYLIENIQPR